MQYEKKGFGYVYQNVMRNKVLTPEAKAIYAYLASFAGNNEMCFPGVELMMDELQMGRERFYKHMKILIENGIVIKEQEKDGSRFSRNIYTINSFPVIGHIDLPQSRNRTTDRTTTDKGTAENTTYNSNSFKSNSIKRNNNKINTINNIVVDTADALPTTSIFTEDSFEILVVEEIIHSCLELYPNSKVPSSFVEKEKWANEISRMKKLDNRTEDEIIQALKFAITDEFWKSNIRSAKKFREKYETLYIQSKQKKTGKQNKGQVLQDEFINSAKEWLNNESTRIS